MTVLLTIPLKEEEVQSLEALGYEILQKNEKDSQYLEDLSGVEVLICYNPFRKLALDRMSDLKFIQLSSIGFDQLPDYDYSKIVICNNHGSYSPQIGEWVVAMILFVFKELRLIEAQQRKHLYKTVHSVQELTGKKVLMLGTGTLAIESAQRLKAFGVKVDGTNTIGHAVHPFETVFPMAELLLRVSTYDIVVCTLPATARTLGMLGETFFSALKTDGVFMNISRGKVVDEQAMVRYASHLKAIVLDVFEQEPLAEDSPLWDLPNAYLSAHNSWVSQWNPQRRFDVFYENLRRYKNGEVLLHRVDLQRGY